MVMEINVIHTIVGILFLVIPAMLLGKLCSRFRISEIFGFVVAGIIFGPFALGGIIPFFDSPIIVIDELLLSFWQISGIIILFSAGLHFTFHDLRKAGIRAATVGIGGVILPLILIFFVMSGLGYGWEIALVLGAALSATSIVVSVTVLEEIKKEKSTEGNILVNAAVLDDVLGLAILSAILALVVTNSLPALESIFLETYQAVGLWFILLLVAVYVLPKIIHAVAITHPASLESRGTNQAVALGSAFGLAAIAGSMGLNPIVGAFAAGMSLANSKLVTQVREFVGRLKVMFAPLFFVIMGAQVNITEIFEVNTLVFVILLATAIVSKVLGSGIPASILLKSSKKGLRIGCGMIARGEIAFVTLGLGLSSGVLTHSLYSTVVFVILATIFIAPELLRYSYRQKNNLD